MTPFALSNYKRVLVFTAHPDDLEIFCGGLISQLSKSAHVYSVIFSEGDRGRWEKVYRDMDKIDFEDLRVEESEKAKEILGFRYVKTLAYDDRHIEYREEDVEKIYNELQRFRPDLILSFEFNPLFNFDPHPDHVNAGKIVNSAAERYRQDGSFDYYLFSSTRPSHYLDITSLRAKKLRAIRCHKSQYRLNRFLNIYLEYLPERLAGLFSGKQYSESYKQVAFT